MPANNASLLRFWTPGYWFTWLVYLYMRGIVLLPLAWQHALGRMLGRCLNIALYPKRHIADRNLAVCFPQLFALGIGRQGQRILVNVRYVEELEILPL